MQWCHKILHSSKKSDCYESLCVKQDIYKKVYIKNSSNNKFTYNRGTYYSSNKILYIV